MSIVTDSTPVEAPKNPDGSTIVQLYSLFATEAETNAMQDAFRQGGTGYGEFKKQLANGLCITLSQCGSDERRFQRMRAISTAC